MNIPPVPVVSLRRGLNRWIAPLGLASILMATSASLLAQEAGAERERRRNGGQAGDNADRRNLNPQDMQDRMMSTIRERFEIKDDEEWKLISERLTKVMELRRTTGGGAMMFGGFGGRGPGGPGGGNAGGDRGGDRGGRGRGGPGGASTEMAALSSAVRDNLPDAEIKSRLERLREMRRDNEAKLTKAQEELRVVLTVRQEATAVMFGLLP